MSSPPPLTDELRAVGRQQPGGWVYAIDPEYSGSESVPPQGVVGAWQVDPDGEIRSEFRPNPNYRPSPTRLGLTEPTDDLDAAVRSAATGHGGDDEVRRALAAATVWFFQNEQGDLHVAREGDERLVYVFSTRQRAEAQGWPHLGSAPGAALVQGLPADVVLLVNPGGETTVRLPVAELQARSGD